MNHEGTTRHVYFSTWFKSHIILITSGKRYVRFQVEAFAILGFSNADQHSHFDVVQKKHTL